MPEKAGHNQAEIAKVIGRHKSTVGRELARNLGLRGYRPKQADSFEANRRQAMPASRITAENWARVELLLRQDWSPEHVSDWASREERIGISHEWIYQYLLRDKQNGGNLSRHLLCQKPRKKRYGASDSRGQLKRRNPIGERPDVVHERCRIGDWEAHRQSKTRGRCSRRTNDPF